MFDRPKIYAESPQNESLRHLETLTAPSSWDSEKFSKVMVLLVAIGKGHFMPAPNRPETIHLQKWRKHFEELLRRTKETGKEYGRVFLVDRGTADMVMSNKISVGTSHQVNIHVIPHPGREMHQKPVGSIHTHPLHEFELGAHGLSSGDYIGFLGDPEQQFMMIAFGENVRILVLKTSVTPNNMQQERIIKKVKDVLTETVNFNDPTENDIVNFNKIICLEFGLTFYMADKESNDLFKRINVVE